MTIEERWALLLAAAKKQPVLTLAIGLVGVATAVSIVRILLLDLEMSLIPYVLGIGMLLMLFFAVVRSVLNLAQNQLAKPLMVLVWFVVAFVIAVPTGWFFSVFFGFPLPALYGRLPGLPDATKGPLKPTSYDWQRHGRDVNTMVDDSQAGWYTMITKTRARVASGESTASAEFTQTLFDEGEQKRQQATDTLQKLKKVKPEELDLPYNVASLYFFRGLVARSIAVIEMSFTRDFGNAGWRDDALAHATFGESEAQRGFQLAQEIVEHDKCSVGGPWSAAEIELSKELLKKDGWEKMMTWYVASCRGVKAVLNDRNEAAERAALSLYSKYWHYDPAKGPEDDETIRVLWSLNK